MEKKHKIIFVDDEQEILDGLRTMLRKQRKEWDMKFVCGGNAAITELAMENYDIIVSDMRMPGIDGAQLLEHVRENYSDMIRIILSGYTEVESAIRAIPLAHRFLLKPCDADTIKSTIDRTCELHDSIRNEQVRKIVGSFPVLPSSPRVHTELTTLLADEDASLKDAAEVVEKDVGISTRVIQVVNSGFFGPSQPITNLVTAVQFLGTQMLRNIVLGVETFANLESNEVGRRMVEIERAHAFDVGRLAESFLNDPKDKESALVGGMLHDVGLLILASEMPEEWAKRTQLLKEEPERSPSDIEKEVFGVTHSEVGAYLLNLWGIPDDIVEAVAYHHCPGKVDTNEFGVLAAVHIANCLFPGRRGEKKSRLDKEFVKAVGVEEKIGPWSLLAAQMAGRSLAA